MRDRSEGLEIFPTCMTFNKKEWRKDPNRDLLFCKAQSPDLHAALLMWEIVNIYEKNNSKDHFDEVSTVLRLHSMLEQGIVNFWVKKSLTVLYSFPLADKDTTSLQMTSHLHFLLVDRIRQHPQINFFCE